MEILELRMRDSFYNYQKFLNSFIDILYRVDEYKDAFLELKNSLKKELNCD